MEKQETIRLKDLSIGYKAKDKTKIVITKINASLYAGKLTCLIGSNGIGKTTLLKTLSGFLPKIDGSIYIKNKEISLFSNKELSQLISVVLTSKLDMMSLTVEEIVAMGRTPYTGFWGNLSKKDNEVVEESMHLVGISDLKHRMINTLSDGERQKMMIAKAFAQETPIILLDEPTAFLDYPSKVEIMQLLMRLASETNKTIFLSSHDLELVLQIANTLWLMDKEELLVGTPEELSLKGALSRFINREGITFDTKTMNIKILAPRA